MRGETRELVEVPHCSAAAGQTARGHVEVSISSIRLVIHWARCPILTLDVACSPCILLTNSLTNVFAALENRPILRDTACVMTEIRSTAMSTQMLTREFDGASGSEKLHFTVPGDPTFVDVECVYN